MHSLLTLFHHIHGKTFLHTWEMGSPAVPPHLQPIGLSFIQEKGQVMFGQREEDTLHLDTDNQG